MSKLIIDNRCAEVPDTQALSWAQQIVGEGRISDGGESYCYATRIKWGERFFTVYARRNKESDTLTVIHG